MSTPEGVALYEYDAVGNILRISTHRYSETSAPVAILAVSPDRGAPGAVVTLYGKGFAPSPADNQVTFAGVAASVTSAAEGKLTTLVPDGATTGPITLTTALGSGASPGPFTVLQAFTVVPESTEVGLGGTVSFHATWGGGPTQDVTWRVGGVAGGNSTLGTISPAGLYTAPPALPPVDPLPIEAVLRRDPTQVAGSRVHVLGQAGGTLAARPVAVGRASPGLLAATPLSVRAVAPDAPLVGSPLTVTAGPVVSALAPASGAAGSAGILLTLMGANLHGASAIRSLRDGRVDPTLTVTQVVPSGDGTALRCTLTISATAPPGPRVLQVLTPRGVSMAFELGTNRFTVTAP